VRGIAYSEPSGPNASDYTPILVGTRMFDGILISRDSVMAYAPVIWQMLIHG
jgi:hypothetical protein